MKSENFKSLFDDITPEWLEEQRIERLEHKKKLTAEYQLGYYVGREIVNRFLPTLSTDMLLSKKVIQVTEEDTKINKQLEEDWLAQKGEQEWLAYLEHNKLLEKKYLPNPLVCYFSILNIEDVVQFKKGLSWALWDCDMCSYNIEPENIKIYDDEDVFQTIIELILI
jgi:hypothetical protein